MSNRHVEQGIEVVHRIAIHRRGVEAAQAVGAQRQRLFEQRRGAGADQHSALRERHQLQRYRLPKPLPGRQHPFDVFQTGADVDVDVAPNVADAGGDRCAKRLRRLLLRRQPQLAPDATFVVGEIADPRAGDAVRLPRQAEQRLVDVSVRVDEPGQQQLAAAVVHRRVGGGGRRIEVDGGDLAPGDQDIDRVAAHGADVAQ
jgi:hypothetical protein